MKEVQFNGRVAPAKPLVIINAGQAAKRQDPLTDCFEAAFHIPGYRGLWLEANSWRRNAANYFAFRSASVPGDLRNHVQRINHHTLQRDPDGVYGALLDLFIVLKDCGLPLRTRMLNSARSLLRDECIQFLDKELGSGIAARTAVPTNSTSMLSIGYVGSSKLVEKIDVSVDSCRDPLQESRSHLEYGQVDEARSVLETAIMEGPLRVAIHEDLLEIYRRTSDKNNFLRVYRQLDTEDNSVSHLWSETAIFFGEHD